MIRENGDTYSIFLTQLFGELNGLIFAKCLEQCVAYSKHSLNVSSYDFIIILDYYYHRVLQKEGNSRKLV